MAKTESPDYHRVEDDQLDIHNRLLNWARWVIPRTSSAVSPMFRNYRSHAWQWHSPEHRQTCDTLDALAIEKTMYKLPDKHRQAVRWCYVYRCTPAVAIREIGVSYVCLATLVRESRFMVRNLTQ
jgi:DNA-directed RNA polymerase specialized sigma24 family protein